MSAVSPAEVPLCDMPAMLVVKDFFGGQKSFAPERVREFLTINYPRPTGGYFIPAEGSDGVTYYVTARTFEAETAEDEEDDRWDFEKWEAEFYRTKEEAIRVLEPGWAAIDQLPDNWYEEDVGRYYFHEDTV